MASILEEAISKGRNLMPGRARSNWQVLDEAKIQAINPYALGMWVILVEDYLRAVTGMKWTWKKPIQRDGNRLLYRWVARKPPGAVVPPFFGIWLRLTAEDLYEVEAVVYDAKADLVASKTIRGLHVGQLAQPAFYFGWVKKVWKETIQPALAKKKTPAPEQGKPPAEDQLLDYLAQEPGRTINSSMLAYGFDMSPGKASALLAKLAKQGKLVKQGKQYGLAESFDELSEAAPSWWSKKHGPNVMEVVPHKDGTSTYRVVSHGVTFEVRVQHKNKKVLSVKRPYRKQKLDPTSPLKDVKAAAALAKKVVLYELPHSRRQKQNEDVDLSEASSEALPATYLAALKKLPPLALRLLNTIKDNPKYRGQAASDEAKNALDKSGLTYTIHALEDPAKDVVKLTKKGQKVVDALRKRGLSAVQVVKEDVDELSEDRTVEKWEALERDIKVLRDFQKTASSTKEENPTWSIKDNKVVKLINRIEKSLEQKGMYKHLTPYHLVRNKSQKQVVGNMIDILRARQKELVHQQLRNTAIRATHGVEKEVKIAALVTSGILKAILGMYKLDPIADPAAYKKARGEVTAKIKALPPEHKEVVDKVLAAFPKRMVYESVAGAPGAFVVQDDASDRSVRDMIGSIKDSIERGPSWTYPDWALPKVELSEADAQLLWRFDDRRSMNDLMTMLQSTWGGGGPAFGVAERWMGDITIGPVKGNTVVLGGPIKLQKKLAAEWNRRGGGMHPAGRAPGYAEDIDRDWTPWDDEAMLEYTKYTGMFGKPFESAVKKGYVDLGMVNPKYAKTMALYKVAEHITRAMKKGVAFVRDPEDVLGKAGVSPQELAKTIREEYESIADEMIGLAGEREDEKDAMAWSGAKKKIKAAKITITPVKGKTGKGYRIVMKPTPEELGV